MFFFFKLQPTREVLISAAITRSKNLGEIEEIGQCLISGDNRHVIQNNGQKTLLSTIKKEPKRGSELYVALPKACLEGFLYAIFSQVINYYLLVFQIDKNCLFLVWNSSSNTINDAFFWCKSRLWLCHDE